MRVKSNVKRPPGTHCYRDGQEAPANPNRLPTSYFDPTATCRVTSGTLGGARSADRRAVRFSSSTSRWLQTLLQDRLERAVRMIRAGCTACRSNGKEQTIPCACPLERRIGCATIDRYHRRLRAHTLAVLSP